MSRVDDLYNQLESKGLSEVNTVYDSMLRDILPLMPSFLAGGGTYSRTGSGDLPLTGISRYNYPIPKMKVMYGDNSLVIKKEIHYGYPVLVLVERSKTWDTHLVHPDHLDTALCFLLEVPHSTPSN